MANGNVKTSGVIKEFGDKVKTRVLFGIDLELKPGEFTALIGPSGSGKSTLLNILGALERPTEGQVIIDEFNLNDLDDDGLAYFRNRTIGFIFQFHFLLPQFTVLENVLIPHLIYAGRADKQIEASALKYLELVGVGHLKDSYANAISGGEQQRVAIARALINQPRLILADEPTGNLDSRNSNRVFDLLREINQEVGTSFIMVTHNQALAHRADRLIELRDGQIVCDEYL
jgi:lipoprotein-releasing system ATP-binding protein